MNRTNDSWVLDPRAQGPDVYSHQGAPSGVGNHVSCEFNLIYRWHATLSKIDEKWVSDFLRENIFRGRIWGRSPSMNSNLECTSWIRTIILIHLNVLLVICKEALMGNLTMLHLLRFLLPARRIVLV